jgi:hypothetical protein
LRAIMGDKRNDRKKPSIVEAIAIPHFRSSNLRAGSRMANDKRGMLVVNS